MRQLEAEHGDNSEALLECECALVEEPVRDEGSAVVERDAAPGPRVTGGLERLAKVRAERLDLAVGPLEDGELVQHGSALLRCGRFLEGPPEVAQRGLGAATEGGFAGRGAQGLDHRRASRRGHLKEMARDLLGVRTL